MGDIEQVIQFENGLEPGALRWPNRSAGYYFVGANYQFNTGNHWLPPQTAITTAIHPHHSNPATATKCQPAACTRAMLTRGMSGDGLAAGASAAQDSRTLESLPRRLISR